jgi:hypothetical protein
MSRSVIHYDPSVIHPHAEVGKIRPTQRVSAASPNIYSRTSASNKIAHEDNNEEVFLGKKVRSLLLDCYNYNINLNENLRALLKLLTANCPKYIDGVFAGHTDYNDYDLKKYGKLYGLKKFYYENLMKMYSSGCSNPDAINSIYSTYFNYLKGNIKKEQKNKLLKEQLLQITQMTPYIREIIEDTQNPQEPSQEGGKTNKPPRNPQPTKLLFGKVRCIYKKSGDKKEYVKHKGLLITIKQYKDIRTRATKNRGK